MIKATRARYTLGFKQEAASRTLGLVEQTLFNWVKAHREGKLKGAASRSKVTAEQMGISRLRAEPARVTMECDILHPSDEGLLPGCTLSDLVSEGGRDNGKPYESPAVRNGSQ